SVADLLKPKHKIGAHNNQAEVSVTDLLKYKRVANETSLADLLKHKKMANEASLLKPKHKKKAGKTSVASLLKSKHKKMDDKLSVTDLLKKLNKWCVYICNCNQCNGVEVDPHTQKAHAEDKCLWSSSYINNDNDHTMPYDDSGSYDNIDIAPYDNAIHTINENADNSNNKPGSEDESISDNFSEDEDWELEQDIVQNEELFKSPEIDNDESFIINDLNDSLDTEII
ncbi:12483_t:CDS:2, partial [Racocetra fulgida]